ncbi:MAG: hypothetical protein WDM77_10590 [Steroidobacteraceae bacterium]
MISRATAASDLLALDNPTSRLIVRAGVTGAATTSTRDIVLGCDDQAGRAAHSRPE